MPVVIKDKEQVVKVSEKNEDGRSEKNEEVEEEKNEGKLSKKETKAVFEDFNQFSTFNQNN